MLCRPTPIKKGCEHLSQCTNALTLDTVAIVEFKILGKDIADIALCSPVGNTREQAETVGNVAFV